ncbi:hypothetical protein CYMTET_40507 [Cymbomonas tetramitiformis]|uniref:Uncharacterized protein n=1 Tax=Cymbomonas tetramitiformis TaxID=36881 RepID=A0AAE0F368_9CHLO|nr:hypothetical protein CYMTET_40507 [Cymbomonas tetramitiformis]
MAASPASSDQEIHLADIQNMEEWARTQAVSDMQIDPPVKEDKPSSPYSSAQSGTASGSTEASKPGDRITTDEDVTSVAQTFFHKYGPPPRYKKAERAPKRDRVVTFDDTTEEPKAPEVTAPAPAEAKRPEGEQIQLTHSKVRTPAKIGNAGNAEPRTGRSEGDQLGRPKFEKRAKIGSSGNAGPPYWSPVRGSALPAFPIFARFAGALTLLL